MLEPLNLALHLGSLLAWDRTVLTGGSTLVCQLCVHFLPHFRIPEVSLAAPGTEQMAPGIQRALVPGAGGKLPPVKLASHITV